MGAGDLLQRVRAHGAARAGLQVAFERREAGCRAAQTASHRDGISRECHRAEPRRPRVLAEERHADHPTPARGRGVAADDGDAMRSGGVSHARVEGVHVLRLGRGGEGEGDQRPSRIAAHRGDVGEVDGEGLPADIVEGRRRSAEVHVLHDRSVVASRTASRATSSTAVSSPMPVLMPVPAAAGFAQPADQSELAELLDPRHLGHSSTGRARPRRTSAASAYSEGRSRPSCGAQTFASIFFLIWALGTAPMTWSTTSPLLMNRMVGMERMP